MAVGRSKETLLYLRKSKGMNHNYILLWVSRLFLWQIQDISAANLKMSRWLGLTTLVAFAAAFLEECQEGEDCEALEMLQLRARKTEQDLLLNASNEARTPGSV